MKKAAALVVAILVVFIAVAGGASYWLRIRARHAYGVLVEQIARGGGFGVSDLKFHNGLLTTTATAILSPPGIPLHISLVSHIRPGPFPGITHLNFMPGMGAVHTRILLASPLLPGLLPVTVHTMIYLAGNSVTTLNIPGYRHNAPGGKDISWRMATGDIVAAADQKALHGRVDFPAIQVPGPHGTVSVSQLAFRWGSVPLGMDQGRSSLSIGRVVATGPGGTFSVDGLDITLDRQLRSGKLSVNVAAQGRVLGDGIGRYGPGRLSIRIRGLDARSLDGFERSVRSLPANLSPHRREAETRARLKTLLLALSRGTPTLDVTKLSVVANGSAVAGKGRFVMDGTNVGGSGYSGLLMSALSGSLDLLVPRSVVADIATDDIRRQLDAYKSQGTLNPAEVRKLTPRKVAQIVRSALPAYLDQVATNWHLTAAGSNYTLSIAIKHGQVLANGQPVDRAPAAH